MKVVLYFAIAVVLSFILPACSGKYYKTKAVTSKTAFLKILEKSKENKRYFILYSGINIYSVTSVDVDKAKQQFTVQLDKVDSLNTAFLNDTADKKIRPKNVAASSSSKILLFMSDSTSYTLDEPHTLLIEKVAKIELVN